METPPAAAAKPAAGYWPLVRGHRPFRNLWLAEVVSLTGDWFTTIALFAMLLKFTGRAESVGYALIARFVPSFVFGAAAGVFADRFDRRTIMIACDLSRAVVVLGFLLVRGPEDVWLAYLLSFVQVSLTSFFEPAEQAAVGAIVGREQIVAANALQGMTWSAMLSLGALLGGLVTELVGRDLAFVIDAATYLCSAFFVSRAEIPRQPAQAAPRAASWLHMVGYHEVVDGLRFVWREPRVRKVIFAKAGWGLAGGGAILLYSVFGERVFPVGASAAGGIGLLYAARGVGALLGPPLARVVGGDEEASLLRFTGLGFFLVALAYLGFAFAPNLALAALALLFAHMGVSTVWVFSTALMNLWVPDALKGRTFAADLSLFTLALALSTWGTGAALDHFGVSPRVAMAALAVLLVVPALLFQARPVVERTSRTPGGAA